MLHNARHQRPGEISRVDGCEKLRGRETVGNRRMLLYCGRKISFFYLVFSEFEAADITGIGDKRRPLFLDTRDFAMLHRALLTGTPPRDLEK